MVVNRFAAGCLALVNHCIPSTDVPGGDVVSAWQAPRRLWVLPSRFIGDGFLLLPFFHHLRQNLPPETVVDVLATPATADLFQRLPAVNHVILEADAPRGAGARQTWLRGYDTVFLLRYSWPWGQAAAQAGIPQRVGFDLQRLGIQGLQDWGRCLTHPIASTGVLDPTPQTEIYLNVLRGLGLRVDSSAYPPFPQTAAEQHEAAQWIASHPRPWFLLHTTAGSPGKAWPLSYWGQVSQALQRDFHGTLFAIGVGKERHRYDVLSARWGVPIQNLCGRSSLGTSVALLARMDLALTLDTAVAHMAAVAGTPRLIVLYGPTQAAKWRPDVRSDVYLAQLSRQLPCQPCLTRTCTYRRCLLELEPGDVLQAVARAFEAKPLG